MINKKILISFLTLVFSVALHAQSFSAVSGTESVQGAVPGPGLLLWDNSTIITPGTSGLVSVQGNNLAVGVDRTNSADDFVIPAGENWTVDFVFSVGFSTGALDPDYFGIVFYQDAGGLPGAVIAEEQVTFGGAISSTEQQMTLANPVTLGPGTYWVSVYGGWNNFVDLATNRWNWTFAPEQIGADNALQDLVGLFGGIPWTSCAGLGVPDCFSFQFALRGSQGPIETDLTISKTSNAAGTLSIGDSLAYNLTVANTGGALATNVVITDNLPANLTYTSSSCSDGTSGVVVGQNVTFNLNDIASGASTSCNIVTSVSGFGQISNTATVSADNDPTTANNSSTANANGPVQVIPSLTFYGLLIMALALVFFARRRVK